MRIINNNPITTTQLQAMWEQYKNGKSIGSIASNYCYHRSTIINKFKSHGYDYPVLDRNTCKLSKKQLDEIVDGYNNKMTIDQLSKKHKVAIRTIDRILIRNKVKKRKQGQTLHISGQKQALMCEEYIEGMTGLRKLAVKWNVSFFTIRKILVENKVKLRDPGSRTRSKIQD